jgi:hypothetical protein
MTIQINTDHNISENENQIDSLKKLIRDSLERYGEHITRIEVHISDENGKKEGPNNKRCVLEVRLEDREPIAVIGLGNSIEEALNDAIGKITASLNTILGKIKSHH